MRMLLNNFRDDVDVEQNFDYGARTDGQPDYYAWNDIGADEAATNWSVTKYTYDGSDNVSKIQSRKGSWTGRVALFS